MEIIHNYSLKRLNTFAVNAIAKVFVDIKGEDELIEILSDTNLKNYRKFILGGGSNILFTKDFDGLVIKNSVPGIEIISADENTVTMESGAGEIWNDLVTFCVNRNFGGIENLALIPGTVGAAPVQNIGAYGEELSETFISLDGISMDSSEKVVFNKDDCRFGYRNSIFKNELKNKFIITKVRLRLNKNPKIKTDYGNVMDELEKTSKTRFSIKDISEVISKIRREKLPDPAVIGNAGSFFKNPEIEPDHYDLLRKQFPDLKGFPADGGRIKLSAAWLIDKAGWKGFRKGNTGTHINHALVIVNYGDATGEEILHFAKEIKKSIYEKYNVILEEEVNII
jgi:UDP-N-acetylmuramate dehydrogenase